MDYLYFSSIKNHSPKTVVVSYDIACQWSTNLTRRSATYPPELVSSANELSVRYLVPKFHPNFTFTPTAPNVRLTIHSTLLRMLGVQMVNHQSEDGPL